MAKASTQWYQVTDKSDLSYNGKTVGKGSVVSDIPGESISWLLSNGNITPVITPSDGSPTIAPTAIAALQTRLSEARAAKLAQSPTDPAPATPPTNDAPADTPTDTTTTEGK